MTPSPPVGGEGWGEAGAAPATLLVPLPGAHQLVHVEADFFLRRQTVTRLIPK